MDACLESQVLRFASHREGLRQRARGSGPGQCIEEPQRKILKKPTMYSSTQSCVLSLDQLLETLNKLRSEGPLKVVHCHGVFDLVHIGHIRHLEAAKRLGDLLIVTVTPDEFVNKGPSRPIFPDTQRAEALGALACVDYVAINRWPTSIETISMLKPNLYVKGQEYRQEAQDITGKIGEEIAAVRAQGGEVAFTNEIVHSSTQLIQDHLSPLDPLLRAFVSEFQSQHSFEDVKRYIDGASKLKVLVVGETIIDEYQYCDVIGKSSKEPTLVAKRTDLERFAGGILAVANHVADFCDQVSMLTVLGQTNPMQAFVESHLHPKVESHFVMRDDGPTIIKRRFVDRYLFQKLFELYDLNDVELNDHDNQVLCQSLEELLPQHDVVIVVDYGHGFLSQRAIQLLCEKSKFLAVNTQCNAGNQGYHTISHYERANFVVTTEKELRLEARSRGGDLKEVIHQVAKRLAYDNVCITLGKHGCLVFNSREGFVEAPALTDRVVDRIGAGDAFLAVAALCAAQKAPLPIIGLAGNAAGAQAVATVCNLEPVRRMTLLRHLQALLK